MSLSDKFLKTIVLIIVIIKYLIIDNSLSVFMALIFTNDLSWHNLGNIINTSVSRMGFYAT